MKRIIIFIVSILFLGIAPVFAYPPTPLSTGSSAQDMQISWEPSNVALPESGILFNYGLEGITALTFDTETISALSIVVASDLTSIAFPNLTTSGMLVIAGCENLETASLPLLTQVSATESGLEFALNTLLSSIDLSSLQSVSDHITIDSCGITSLDLSALVTCNDMTIQMNTLLTTLILTSFVPTNEGTYIFANNALSASAVNAILARFVANAEFIAGTIDLSGGTNSAPTGQGLTDVTTLRARGVTVTVNGE